MSWERERETDVCTMQCKSIMWIAVMLMSVSMMKSAEAALVTKTFTMPLPGMLGGMVLNTREGQTTMEMPAGRIALKAFNGELVEARDPEYVFEAGRERDEDFVPVPLSKLCTFPAPLSLSLRRSF